jgi:hypothetical protein
MNAADRVMWVYCHHSVAHPQDVVGGESFQIWVLVANMLNRRQRLVLWLWGSMWVLTPHCKNQNVTLGLSF